MAPKIQYIDTGNYSADTYMKRSWRRWNNEWYTTTNTSSASTTWSNWNIQYGTLSTTAATTTYTVDNTWTHWNRAHIPIRDLRFTSVETTEQVEQRRRAHAEAAEKRQQARRTARMLLLSILDDDQAEEFERHNRFFTVGSDGRRYMIKLGRQHNVFVVDDQGRAIEELCGHVRDYIPDEDNMLAQKLHIETDALGFRAVCNIWDLTGGRRHIIHHSGQPLAERELVAA